jgi:hypothetical protein
MRHLEKLEALRSRTTGTCVFTLATLTAREAGEVATVTVEERAALVSVERAAVVRLPTEAEVWPGVVMARGGSWVWDRKLSRCNLV